LRFRYIYFADGAYTARLRIFGWVLSGNYRPIKADTNIRGTIWKLGACENGEISTILCTNGRYLGSIRSSSVKSVVD